MVRMLIFSLVACTVPDNDPVEPIPEETLCAIAYGCFVRADEIEERIECRELPAGEQAGEAWYVAVTTGDTRLTEACFEF